MNRSQRFMFFFSVAVSSSMTTEPLRKVPIVRSKFSVSMSDALWYWSNVQRTMLNSFRYSMICFCTTV